MSACGQWSSEQTRPLEATATEPWLTWSLSRDSEKSMEGAFVLMANSSLLESTGQSTDIDYFVFVPTTGL